MEINLRFLGVREYKIEKNLRRMNNCKLQTYNPHANARNREMEMVIDEYIQTNNPMREIH